MLTVTIVLMAALSLADSQHCGLDLPALDSFDYEAVSNKSEKAYKLTIALTY